MEETISSSRHFQNVNNLLYNCKIIIYPHLAKNLQL